jgi:AcrR family transcriptional regulator
VRTRSRTPKPRAPRGRHRAGTAVIEKGRRSVDEILDAATALLAEDGYAALSTRKVSARAGMHPGNLQYYFPAKRDMVRALLERYLDHSLERLAHQVERGDQSSEAQLRSAISGILAQQHSKSDCTLFRELWALASHDADVAAAMSDFYRQYRTHVGVALRSVSPELGRGESERLAMAVVAMLEGLSIVAGPGKLRNMPGPVHVCDMVMCLATPTPGRSGGGRGR